MILTICGILHKLIFGKMVAQRMGDRIIRRSTTEQVYTLIIEKIRRGEFAPGERLKIESLSREFGVSRTPIREAIGMLTQNGFLEHVHNVGPQIPAYDRQLMQDLVETCNILTEGVVQTLFRKELPKGLADELRQSVEQQRQALAAGEQETLMHHCIHFHEIIFAWCPNKKLAALADQMQNQLDAPVRMYQESEAVRKLSVEQHEGIAQAFQQGDRELVLKRVKEHNMQPLEFFMRKE